jgi:tRNA threonylcarbamoyladenosine biosynthesis protein TsaB
MTMRFLLIETCTERGVIAYGNQNEILFTRELPFGPSQSKYLMPYLTEALHSFGFPPSLDAIGVGIGPGSYTGIRLGVSVAQALAYSWKIPLVGVSSLEGFVPSVSCRQYAAILDARIGGAYFQKGRIDEEGVLHKSAPQVASLEEIGPFLEDATHLVTPFAKSLQAKLKQCYPESNWIWEESSPSVPALLQSIEQAYREGKTITPPDQLNLLYLRQTEAEREKARRTKGD